MSKLIPIRIPPNWAISTNTFFDDEPIVKDGVITNYLSFKEDVLFIEECRRNVAGNFEIDSTGHFLDLGWYPDSDPNGRYTLKFCKGDRNNELFKYSSSDKRQITKAIELCLESTSNELIKLDSIFL